ncbi:MAG TPA: hypothetical protein VE270_11580, partial [Thermoleophilaceae bacterium]|nr:hypothetical protein [Thermoleophilaceae bacterium]
SRLAWELKVPLSSVERVTDHRVVFRSWRELTAGGVFFTGRARVRRTLTLVGDWRVYRREQLTFPLADARAKRGARLYTEFAGN